MLSKALLKLFKFSKSDKNKTRFKIQSLDASYQRCSDRKELYVFVGP